MDTKVFHLCTDALKNNLICRDGEDYTTLWNLLALAAWECRIKIFCFCLMSNHFHILVQAEEDYARSFINYLKRKMIRFQAEKYGKTNLSDLDFKLFPVSGRKMFCNEVAYILRNPYKSGITHPFAYPWSSIDAYFRKEDPHTIRLGELPIRVKRKIFKGKAIPTDDYQILGDRVASSSFVEWKSVEEVFEQSPILFFNYLRKWNLEEMVDEQHGQTPVDAYTDEEVSRGISEICRDVFNVSSPAQMDRRSKLQLVRKVANRFGCSRAQLMRLLSIDADTLERLL